MQQGARCPVHGGLLATMLPHTPGAYIVNEPPRATPRNQPLSPAQERYQELYPDEGLERR